MHYFNNYNLCELFIINNNKLIKKNKLLIGFKSKYNFFVGDIIEVVSFRKNLPIIFEEYV
jgi:hypothetical protein